MSAFGPEALDLVRRRVINVIGHELRTPLTTVRGLAELLLDTPDDEQRDELILALVRNARRAEQLVDDLLIAGEITTAHPTDEPTTVELAPLVADAVADTAVSVQGTPPGPVLAHPEAVGGALHRLVDNADRYADGDASVHFEADAHTVAVVVTAPIDGHIPDLDLSFELFFRGERAVTRAPGLGLGLPVARALARMDGGEVTIEHDDAAVVTTLRLPRLP